MRIDAQQYVGHPPSRSSALLTAPELRRSFGMEARGLHLRRELVDGTVLVQAAASMQETEHLIGVAWRDSRILGVVGWVDLSAPSVAEEIAGLRAIRGGSNLVGFRHVIAREPDPKWLLRPGVIRGLQAVADAGLVFELLARDDQLETVAAAVSQVRGGKWILDRAGSPPIATGVVDPWRVDLQRIASHRNVACKLSGLIGLAGPNWTLHDLAPYVRQVLWAFGSDRVIAGTDWPMCLLTASYQEVTQALARLLQELPAAEQQDVFGGTAERWYSLAVRAPAVPGRPESATPLRLRATATHA